LWIDAHLRGTRADNIIGAAIGRIDQRLALAPNDMVSTIIRVDQDALFAYFNNNPNLDLLVNLTLVMNPTRIAQSAPGQPDTARPGLCGYSVQSTDLIAREPVPVGTDDQAAQLLKNVDPAVGGDKIRLMQILYVYIARLRDSQYAKAPELIKTFFAKLRRAQTDGNPAVESWQKFLIATLVTSADDRFNAINAMSQDSYWQTRLLALEAARELLGAKGHVIASQLSSDTDPIVSSYAVALAQSIPAATQPSDATQTPAAPPNDATQTPELAPGSAPAAASPSDSPSDSPAQPAVSPDSSLGNPKE
jgi:hypothetical protein